MPCALIPKLPSRTAIAISCLITTAPSYADEPVGFSTCLSPPEVGAFRRITSSKETEIDLSDHDGKVDVCIVLSGCAWVIKNQEESVLGVLDEYATGRNNKCDNTSNSNGWKDGRTWLSVCTMPGDLLARLAPLETWLDSVLGPSDARECGNITAPLEGMAGLVRPDSPSLILETKTGAYCLSLALSLAEKKSAALVRKTCLSASSEMSAFSSRWLSAPGSSVWFGAEEPPIGFSVALDEAITQASTSQKPIISGDILDKDYISEWLRAIGAAAASEAIQAEHGPLPHADQSRFIGRIAQWLTAGMVRLSPKPFDYASDAWEKSRGARDWMAMTVLSNPTIFEGTLLRAENARKDWSPQ
jgi:hypothetical protein